MTKITKFALTLFRQPGTRYFLNRSQVLAYLGPGHKVRKNRNPARGYDVLRYSEDLCLGECDRAPEMWLVGHIREF